MMDDQEIAALLATVAAYLRAHNRHLAGVQAQKTNDEHRHPRTTPPRTCAGCGATFRPHPTLGGGLCDDCCPW